MRQLKCKSICDAILFSLLSAALAMLGHRAALAQAPFYQGKTITLIAGAGPGGMGDLRARALASALAKNIPGNPTITFQYMPGGGGRKAANHLYNSARADGLTLFRISSSIVPYAVLGESGVQYDVDKLIYLGTTESFSIISSIRARRRGSTRCLNCGRQPGSASAVLRSATPVYTQPNHRIPARYERAQNHSGLRKRRS